MQSNNKNKKILLVANVAKEHVLKFHVPTIKMLKEQGWKVDVACSGDEEIPYCEHQFHMSYKRSPFNLDIIKGTMELKQIIDKGNYDIVYCHTPVGSVAARLASISARRKGTKIVYMAHGYHFYKGAPILNWLLYFPMEFILSFMTDSIVLINKEDYEFTKNVFRHCSAYLINGIGIDVSRFNISHKDEIRKTYRDEMNIPEDATVLIYLAELLKNKNQTFLMRALKYILTKEKNVYLVLAGFDYSEGKFEQYAKNLKIDENIRFLGWREDVGNLYAMADICTASSIREGFGLNLVEAMSCGLPVVATKNRGHETIISDKKNGFLVDLCDEKLFAKRVIQLIRNDQLKMHFVRKAEHEYKKYCSEEVLKNVKSILESHMSDK